MRLASDLVRIQKGEGRPVALVMSLMFMTTAGMMVGESGSEALVVVPFVDRGGAEPRNWSEAFDLRRRRWAFLAIAVFWAVMIVGVAINTDRDVDEPGVSKCVPPSVTGQAARDAVGRQVDVTDRLLRDRSADGDVGELESPVRPQHPEDLAENARALSATRLSTPFEMATSAQPSSMGRSSARPWRNSTWSRPPVRCAATIESKPPPDPTSTTRSPGTADGTRTGGPHQRTTPPPGQGPQRPASGRSRA